MFLYFIIFTHFKKYILLYHNISYCYFIMLYYTMFYYVILYYVMLYDIHCILLQNVILCCDVV